MSIVVNKGQKQLIEFTKEQFKALLKLVFLDRWAEELDRHGLDQLEIRDSEEP